MTTKIGNNGLEIYPNRDSNTNYATDLFNINYKAKQNVPQIGLGTYEEVKNPTVAPVSSIMDGYDYTKGLTMGEDGNIYNNTLSNISKNVNSLIFQQSHNGLTPTQFANNAEGTYSDSYINDELNSYHGTNGVNYASTNNNSADDPFYKNWGYKQWGTAASAGLGLGQLGLGIANYLTQRKVADKQMRLLDQQYANNADLLAHRKSHRAAVEKAFANNASNFV